MFSQNPKRWFRGAFIEVIIFHDQIGDRFTEKRFEGPIQYQLKEALRYIQSSVLVEEVQKIPNQPESLRFYNFPYEAIEEALANAVYHRSYENRNSIEVNVRAHQIEIMSFPGPLPPVDQASLQRPFVTLRDYRNRRIGDFLKELKLTEGRGTGFPKIKQAMKRNGSPPPVFETDPDRHYFLTTLPIHPVASQAYNKNNTPLNQGQTLQNKDKKPISEGANVKYEGVNPLIAPAFIEIDGDNHWERAWDEGQDKLRFQYPLLDPQTKKMLQGPEWTSSLVEKAFVKLIKEFGGYEKFRSSLPIKDSKWKLTFKKIYLKLIQDKSEEKTIKVIKLIVLFQKYKNEFKRAGVFQHLEQLLGTVYQQEGLRAPQYAQILGKSMSTVERYLKQLKGLKLIEFKGASKTGGYFISFEIHQELEGD